MRRIVLAVLLLAAFAAPARAVPPIAAGALASDNVELVLTLPDVPAIGAKILGDTMYVTTSQGLRIYDVSDGIPVPLGALPLPHFQNESVDTNGKILLIAADTSSVPDNTLFVIDVADPRMPRLLSATRTSSGHTATCVLDCRYAWLSGGGKGIAVVDLANPAFPVPAGSFGPNGHNVSVDETGIAWYAAYGGLYAYDLAGYGPGTLTSPPLITCNNPDATAPLKNSPDCSGGSDKPFHNDFIIHNSSRPHAAEASAAGMADDVLDAGELILVTEENWLAASNGRCARDGQFQTGWFRIVNGRPVVENVGRFSIGQGTIEEAEKPAGAVACSSHWFDEREGIVADAWFEQGVRFLDVSDPFDIRQVGYYMPAVTEVWMARFHKVGDTWFVYTFDVARGIDVLTFSGRAGDPTALAPRYNVPAVTFSAPSPEWGYACRVLVA